MKRQFTFLLFVFFSWYYANSQITVDGNTADWNTVPVLSEPGVAPYAKAISDGTNAYFLVTLDNEHAFNPDAWFTVNLYIDADFSATTGQKNWVYPAAGIDYLVEGPDLRKYTGTAGAGDWSWGGIGTGIRTYSTDARSAELSFTLADFTGVALGETWGVALPYYYSTWESGDPNFFPANHWDFDNRKVFVVKPRTEVILNNIAELTSANAYYNPFMKDENIASYLDFQSAASADQNELHWASWAVELPAPTTFNFKMTAKNTGSGKAKLTVVDMATNTIVKAFDDVWYPENADFTENDYGTLDMSDVPAGKYMLKLTNPTTWDTFLKVGKITLTSTQTGTSATESIHNISIDVKANTLHVSTEKPAVISIYTLTGQLVETVHNVNSFQKELQSGFYILTVKSGGEQLSKKIFIQ